MQFHLNGFEPGDPDPDHHSGTPAGSPLVPGVDVLIVGCGPAGLTLAAQLSRFRHQDLHLSRSPPLIRGRADGTACRTMECFTHTPLAERVLKEACWINETTFWKPDENNANIVRGGWVQDVEEAVGVSCRSLGAGARPLSDVMRKSPGLEPYYARRLLDLEIDETAAATMLILSRDRPATARC